MIRQANFLNHRIKFDSELKSKIEKKLSTEAFKYTMKKYKGEYNEIMNESRSFRRSQNKFVPQKTKMASKKTFDGKKMGMIEMKRFMDKRLPKSVYQW